MKKLLPANLFLGFKYAGLSAPVRSGRGLFLFVLIPFLLSTNSFFSQNVKTENKNRDYLSISDSLLKKYRKYDPVIFTFKSYQVATNFFFYRKGNKWNGIYFNDVSLLTPTSQFEHRFTIKSFDTDTVGRKLVLLGLDSLKQYTMIELSEHYNKKMKKVRNPNVDYELPYCSTDGQILITKNNQVYSYADCWYSLIELKDLVGIRAFGNIAHYVLTSVYPNVHRMK